MRALLSVLLAGVLALAAPAVACDLSPERRPAAVAGYMALAGTCLAAPPERYAFDAAAEALFAERVNAERRAAGLGPLIVSAELLPAARFHSLDLAANDLFGHAGAAGRDPFQRIAALDRTLLRLEARENVAMLAGRLPRAETVARLHDGLVRSDGHRANMLAGDLTHMAVGVVTRDGLTVVTQVFVAEIGRLPEPVPARLTALPALPEVPLGDWTPSGISLRRGERPGTDAQLVVRATRPGPQPGSRFIIDLPGPLVTAAPAGG